MTARFNQGDASYDWMVAFVVSYTQVQLKLLCLTRYDLRLPKTNMKTLRIYKSRQSKVTSFRVWTLIVCKVHLHTFHYSHYRHSFRTRGPSHRCLQTCATSQATSTMAWPLDSIRCWAEQLELWGRSYGGSVTVTLHNSKRSLLYELVEAAKEEYLKNTVSKVTVHLSDRVSRVWLLLVAIGELMTLVL